MYANIPKTIEELKATITSETRKISKDMVHRVIENFKLQVSTTFRRKGRHIDHRL